MFQHHAAHLTFLDGVASLPQLATYSRDALRKLKAAALLKLQEIAPVDPSGFVPTHNPANFVQIGSFAIPKGPNLSTPEPFNFSAPTTRDNALRVVRACQVPKPILLEGSPGVGKTSLVTALANLCGYKLHRVNLSDQTDLMDLFGSDLPVEGGGPGEFAWKDAEFLKALQEGDWVLLDEMNLAPQAVLEGLNAVLDHRGTVYIPELGRSFTRHPSFRIFAAQNPLSQGGGRKGLPKSFINRFTKVYIEELKPDDLLLVCQHIFPTVGTDLLHAMITFNTALSDAVCKRSFAHEGSPWEFNLRDVIRWGTLLCYGISRHPSDYLRSVYLHRLRNFEDRMQASLIFDEVFQSPGPPVANPSISISASYLQAGYFKSPRKPLSPHDRPQRILKMQLSALEAAGHCINHSWLAIITGPRNSGKTHLVRALANFTGNYLSEISINSATDTMDILGSFEQTSVRRKIVSIAQTVISLYDARACSKSGAKHEETDNTLALRRALHLTSPTISSLSEAVLQAVADFSSSGEAPPSWIADIPSQIHHLRTISESEGRFEWVDGPLVEAMKTGRWLLLDGANLCNPSVLDRLNSLCEPDGVLTLTERGYQEGQIQTVVPHPNFRLFMSVDPQFGELSRAMRNRGIEIALIPNPVSDDVKILQEYYRLPLSGDPNVNYLTFEALRRGLLSPTLNHPLDSSISTTGRAFDQDSVLSSFLDHSAVLLPKSLTSSSTEAFSQFFTRATIPAYLIRLTHIFSSLPQDGTLGRLRHVLQTFPPSVNAKIGSFREEYALQRGVPLDFLFAQVS